MGMQLEGTLAFPQRGKAARFGLRSSRLPSRKPMPAQPSYDLLHCIPIARGATNLDYSRVKIAAAARKWPMKL